MTNNIDDSTPYFNHYIGDGVYASFDGYQIKLSVKRDHEERIYLEPEVFLSLLEFARKYWEIK